MCGVSAKKGKEKDEKITDLPRLGVCPPPRVGVPLVAGVSAFDLLPRLAPGLGSLAKVPGALLAPPDGWRLHMPTVVLLAAAWSAILPMALSARAYLVEWGVPTEEPARQGLILDVERA